MTADDLSLTIIFLAIFQVMGGMSFGAGLLDLRNRSLGGIPRIIGGLLFGGVPVGLEYTTYFAGHPNPMLLLVGPVVFTVAIFIRVVFWDALMEQVGVLPIHKFGGGIFSLVLAIIAIPLWLDKGEWIPGLLWTGTLTFFGGEAILNGMREIRRGRIPEEAASGEEPQERKHRA